MHIDALSHAQKHIDRLQAAEQREEAAYRELFDRAMNGLLVDSSAKLATPSVSRPMRESTAGEVWDDYLCSDSKRTAQLLTILRLIDAGQGNSTQARLLAQGLLAGCAADYASFYAGEDL